MEMEKMSKVLVAKKKKKLSSGLKDVKTRESTVAKKKEPHVKAPNWNVFEMENFLPENKDENLEIFYQKGMKKSSLPSITTLLSSSNKDSGISSLLDNSIGQPQLSKIEKYARSDDIFITKVASPTFNANKQFNKDVSFPLDRNRKRSQDYSISAMFSDGLSQEDNSGQLGLTYASNPDNFQTDKSLPVMDVDLKKSGNPLAKKLEGKREKEIKTNLKKSAYGLRLESFEPKSNSQRKIFERNKQQKENLSSYGIANSSGSNRELCSIQDDQNSSKTSFPSAKRDLGITFLLRNAIDKLRTPGIENYDSNKEPYIVCDEENQTSSPRRGIDKRSKACSKTVEIIADVDSNNSESHSINITLSDCNLDHSINSEACDDRSIKIIDRRAEWYMDQASGCNEITPDANEDLQHTGLVVNFKKNHSVMGFAKTNNTSQNSFRLSDSLVELLDIGSQLSCQSNISLTPNLPAFNSSQNSKTSFEERNLIHQETRHSSFDIPQSLYIRQRSAFFNQKRTQNKKTGAFQFCGSTGTKNEKFRQDSLFSISQNENYTSGYDCNDGNKENKRTRSIFDPQQQCIGHKDLGLKFIDSTAKQLTSSNSIRGSMKRQYPFNRNSEFFNIELNGACNTCEKEKQAAKNVGIVQNTGSRDQTISVDQSSYSSFNGSDISTNNRMKRSPSNRFWNVSNRVQTSVKRWLEDETDDEIADDNVDRKELLPKRRRLDIDNGGREKGIDIDPKLLLSNYSCEYDRLCNIECFKPKVKLI